MNWSARLPLVAVLCTLPLWSQAQALQATDTFSKDIEEALGYVNAGLPDRALVLLEDVAKRAEATGQKESAVDALIGCRLLPPAEQARTGVRGFGSRRSPGPRDPRGGTRGSFLALATIEGQIDLGNFETAAQGLAEIYADKLPKLWQVRGNLVGAEDTRTSLESKTLSLRQDLEIRIARMTAEDHPQSAAVLAEADRRMLQALLSDDPGTKPRGLAVSIAWLDQSRPWMRSLLEAALKTNARLRELHRQYSDPVSREINLAQDDSHRGVILGALGQLDEAIRLTETALQVFHTYNLLASVDAAEHLCELLLQKGDNDSRGRAVKVSRLVVGLVEGETFVQVAQTVDPFLQEYRNAYKRHAGLLWTRYQELLKMQSGEAREALNEVLIHEDRFNFRAVRRDMAVYHDLGESIAADDAARSRIDERLEAVLRAERTAAAEQRALAARDFVTALEDIKRKETRRIGIDPTITAFMKNVTAGMSANDGVLMYFTNPGGETYAALIGAGDTRIYPLGAGATAEGLGNLVSRLEKEIAASPQATLDRLSAMLIAPLPQLPRRLTVVLNPHILGVPFEALKTPDGRLLIETHEIRYTFGLYRNVGTWSPPASIRRAMVVGAEAFDDNTVESLPQSRQEVEGIRALLSRLKVGVTPQEGMPQKGDALLADQAPYQLIHISTHSRLDGTVPILDSLLFPKDRIYAHQFALAPLRSDLVVLSACALYQRRSDRLYPVSGLTMAALARVAPQVLSPLWEVNADATYIFMLRFYSALAERGDAIAALAQTKRDFASGSGLRQWLKSSGIHHVRHEDVSEYRQPYYWAPFVLTTGVSSH
jgi:CHAT domain-containing protein